MQKAVQGLRKLGYVDSTSGRFGGLNLAVPASSIRIGSVVAALESMGHLVNCNKGPCPLDRACLLKLALDRAERAFFLELDQYSLADVVRGPTANVLDMLLSALLPRLESEHLIIAGAALTARSYPSRLAPFLALA